MKIPHDSVKIPLQLRPDPAKELINFSKRRKRERSVDKDPALSLLPFKERPHPALSPILAHPVLNQTCIHNLFEDFNRIAGPPNLSWRLITDNLS